MASRDGSFGGGDWEEKDDFMKPSPSQLQLTPQHLDDIHPDSEENVQQQTTDLFVNFVYQSYRNDNIHQSYDNTPVDPLLVSLPRIPDSPAAEIGRRLARIGDDINERYKDTFNEMIRSMNIAPTCEATYEAFSGVARKLFAEGVNWGRIITLLCFGYRMAVEVLKNHAGKFAEFLYQIGAFLLKFLVAERIARWIADHGGWRGALTFSTSMDSRYMAAIVSLAVASVIVVIAWNRYYV